MLPSSAEVLQVSAKIGSDLEATEQTVLRSWALGCGSGHATLPVSIPSSPSYLPTSLHSLSSYAPAAGLAGLQVLLSWASYDHVMLVPDCWQLACERPCSTAAAYAISWVLAVPWCRITCLLLARYTAAVCIHRQRQLFCLHSSCLPMIMHRVKSHGLTRPTPENQDGGLEA